MRKTLVLLTPILLAGFTCLTGFAADDSTGKTDASAATTPAGIVVVVVDHNGTDQATADFKFKQVTALPHENAAAKAKITIVTGTADDASGDVSKLVDGKGPTEEDQPDENFFFAAGTPGGRLQMDLGSVIDVKQISTYSWHTDARAPQVYEVYASDGTDPDFVALPGKDTELAKHGWKLIAQVDARPKDGDVGGQYGVSILATNGLVGKYRYLLFDCHCTDSKDMYSNTFFSEINVLDANSTVAMANSTPMTAPNTEATRRTFDTADGKYHITIDCSTSPDLADWSFGTLAPIVLEWYPKLVDMLPSDGFKAPQNVSIRYRDTLGQGTPAYTQGSRISLNAAWFAKNLKGEAAGAVIHEMVHVVQQYWGRPSYSASIPGWVIEGIPDYIRFFKYQPEYHGADDIWLKHLRPTSLRYDGSYRITANFLNWVTEKYDPNFIQKLNAASRQGHYGDDVWKASTQKTAAELGAEWLAAKKQEFGYSSPATNNSAATPAKTQ